MCKMNSAGRMPAILSIMNIRAEIIITGRVQGVFFRQGVKHTALELGLVGWVRNEPDGTVRIVAQGQREQLQKLVEWCKKGTEWTKIEHVQPEWKEATGEFERFEVK